MAQTLPQNLADNADYPDAIFILLNYSSEDNLTEIVQPITDPRLFVYHYEHLGLFRMAHSKNLSHRLGIHHGADILVNMDADNFTGRGFARYIAKMYELYGRKSFLWARMTPRCNAQCEGGSCILPRKHEVAHTSSEEILEWLYPENERPHVRGIAGRLGVTRETFLLSGGYDEEKYDHWGPDDRDFNMRIQRLGVVPREINGRYLVALHHSDRMRFKEYPKVRTMDDCTFHALEGSAGQPPYTAVVNFGRAGIGRVTERNGTQLVVNPYPTRIFGIGMHKTGSTSLWRALVILGYEATHWTNPRCARTIFEELRLSGKSLALEKFDAIVDFPIGLLYQELDRSYPGSKFILTVRDENQWLRSVQDHWSYEKNPWRKDWDSDCFTHRLHTEVYGRKMFDPAVMLERYRRHNAEVREYFKDRPDDLLVMKSGWEPLCGFLGRTIPSIPYPFENLTRSL